MQTLVRQVLGTNSDILFLRKAMVGAPSVKVKRAVDYIEESCRIVADSISLVGKYVDVGVTTAELDKIAEDFILSHNAVPSFKGYQVPWQSDVGGKKRYLTYQYASCMSVNDEIVHGLPSARKLQSGDILSFDVGVYKNGYHGDSAYTFAVGNVSAETKKLPYRAQYKNTLSETDSRVCVSLLVMVLANLYMKSHLFQISFRLFCTASNIRMYVFIQDRQLLLNQWSMLVKQR
jgi:hypothetical protein